MSSFKNIVKCAKVKFSLFFLVKKLVEELLNAKKTLLNAKKAIIYTYNIMFVTSQHF